jgi:hypothetical protein
LAYTPSPLQSFKAPNNFGALRPDANHYPIQAGAAIQTVDATGTPVASPVTVNTTQTLTVPPNAASVVICSVTNPVQISEDSTQSAFFALPAGTPYRFELADQAFLYLKTGSSTVVSFLFELI